jgi:AraC family transcriptional regulator
MHNSRVIYEERVNRVIDYVRAHLNQPLSLDELAGVAFFSPYHFHRIFTAITGETVSFFTNRLRLEKAARLLKYSEDSATNIALECGFSSSSTFSRAFKQYFGTSPREYKKTGVIEKSKIRKELFPIREYILPMSGDEMRQRFPVEIRDFPPRRVAFERITGAYEGDRVLRAFERLVQWARKVNLLETETVFGMSIDDPLVTPRDKYRYKVCMTLPTAFTLDAASGLSEMEMPGGPYAVTRATGDIKQTTTATAFLFEHWLIDSPYEPEHRPALEIFLDKDAICDWDRFDLELCVPVRSLRGYH